MLNLEQDDYIETKTHGFLEVKAVIPIEPNNNPNYDKLGGRTLYWLQDIYGDDVLLFDTELKETMVDEN